MSSFTVKKVILADIRFDYKNYQRVPDMARVKKIANAWDDALTRQPILNMRKGGCLYAMDGQHTILAKLEKYGNKSTMMCKVYDGLSVQDEARIFKELNTNVKKPSYNAILKARIAMNEELATDYINAIKASGVPFSLDMRGGHGTLVCHSAIYKAFLKYDQEVFATAMNIAYTAWHNAPEFYRADVMCGLFRFCDTYKGKFNVDKAAKKISQQPLDDIIRWAKGIAPQNKHIGESDGKYFAAVFVDIYNKNLRVGRLDKMSL